MIHPVVCNPVYGPRVSPKYPTRGGAGRASGFPRSSKTSGNVLSTLLSPSSLAVSRVSGSPSNVGSPVAGTNGGLFTIASNGAWTFDPDGDFAALTGTQTATTSVTYHVSDGVAEDEGVLTVTVSTASLFYYADTFDTLNASLWESVGLASLTVTDGKLVPMSNQSTWDAWASNYVKWIGGRPKNFETQIDLAWEEAGKSNMGQVLFWIELSNGSFCYFGLVDDGAAMKGLTRYAHPANPSGVTYESDVDYVSSRTIKWLLLDGEIKLYVGGALVFTAVVGMAVPSKIGLGHTRFTTYPAVVARWDNFSIHELASELLGDVYKFDGGYNANLWDLTKMASATVANEYLSFIGNASTWQNYVGSMVEFLGTKPSGDCEIEAQFGWVYGASCLGELFLYVSTSAANYKVGMYDEGNNLLGSLQAFIPGATSSRLDDQPDKGAATVKLVISGVTISAYANGVLLCSGTFDGGAITKIGLTNTRYSTCNGVTTRLYYLRIREV